MTKKDEKLLRDARRRVEKRTSSMKISGATKVVNGKIFIGEADRKELEKIK